MDFAHSSWLINLRLWSLCQAQRAVYGPLNCPVIDFRVENPTRKPGAATYWQLSSPDLIRNAIAASAAIKQGNILISTSIALSTYFLWSIFRLLWFLWKEKLPSRGRRWRCTCFNLLLVKCLPRQDCILRLLWQDIYQVLLPQHLSLTPLSRYVHRDRPWWSFFIIPRGLFYSRQLWSLIRVCLLH